MIRCAKCNQEAKYKIVKRFNFFPVSPIYVCPDHKQRFERNEDIFLLLLLFLALGATVGTYLLHMSAQNEQAAQQIAQQQEIYDIKDLDQDGYVSWFEDQVTAKQRQNFEKIGYPFREILLPGDPTKAIKAKIPTESFLEELDKPDENNTTVMAEFPHPKLMRAFIEAHTGPTAKETIHGIYLTHHGQIAIVLGKPEAEEISQILIENLSEAQDARLSALTDKSASKKKKK